MKKSNKPFFIVLLALIIADAILYQLGVVEPITFTIIALSFVQNTSFSMVSRSRNRDNMNYHAIASLFSNTLWFFTMKMLVDLDMDFWLFIPYATGTIAGSVFGVRISMIIEKILDASADGHLNIEIKETKSATVIPTKILTFEELEATAKKHYPSGTKFRNMDTGVVQTTTNGIWGNFYELHTVTPEKEWGKAGAQSDPLIYDKGKWAEKVEE